MKEGVAKDIMDGLFQYARELGIHPIYIVKKPMKNILQEMRMFDYGKVIYI